MKIWAADGKAGLMLGEGGRFRAVGPPGQALCAGEGRVFCAGTQRCFCYDGQTGRALFDFPAPPGVCALEMMGDKVYALSAEADSVTAFSARTGEMLVSAPAGSYPRAMKKSPGGVLLAVAGGAAGEVLLLDEDLRCVDRHRVSGAACDVCFLPRGMAVLCAVEEGELCSRLVTISPRGVQGEALRWPQAPCCLEGLPAGDVFVGVHGAVLRMRRDGRLAGRRACAYPGHLRAWSGGVMTVDPWEGTVRDGLGQCLYRGAPEDAVATR